MVTDNESTTRTGMATGRSAAAVDAAWKVADRPDDNVMQTTPSHPSSAASR